MTSVLESDRSGVPLKSISAYPSTGFPLASVPYTASLVVPVFAWSVTIWMAVMRVMVDCPAKKLVVCEYSLVKSVLYSPISVFPAVKKVNNIS